MYSNLLEHVVPHFPFEVMNDNKGQLLRVKSCIQAKRDDIRPSLSILVLIFRKSRHLVMMMSIVLVMSVVVMMPITMMA